MDTCKKQSFANRAGDRSRPKVERRLELLGCFNNQLSHCRTQRRCTLEGRIALCFSTLGPDRFDTFHHPRDQQP